jgi:hypothetical protein
LGQENSRRSHRRDGQHLAEKISTIPEMRRFLAVKGYRELREAIERDIAGKSGTEALHALI